MAEPRLQHLELGVRVLLVGDEEQPCRELAGHRVLTVGVVVAATQDPDPVATMRAGIDRALATPEIEGGVTLVQPQVYYEYADPRLEQLDPLQKQLLRMGPENMARIKTYLGQLKPLL